MNYLKILSILIFTISCNAKKENTKNLKGANQTKLAPFSWNTDAPKEAVGLSDEIITTINLAKEIPKPDGLILNIKNASI